MRLFFQSRLILLGILNGLGDSRLVTVPTIPFEEKPGDYSLRQLENIVVDARYAQSVDNDGQTLIPPTLRAFAETFQQDLASTLGTKIPIIEQSDANGNSIFLTINKSLPSYDAAGRYTSEGYSLTVDESGIEIAGVSPLGTWWGTRSLLQLAALNSQTVSYGSGVDAPGWASRGLMLDAGRHYYPPDFLVEMCSYMSFFKQNVFHLHISDNLYNNVEEYSRERSLDLYAAFRPWSEDPAVAGLNRRRNESYTREEFDTVQKKCAARGVTIIPEIEAPGHALVIAQWKPELGLDDLSLLNISYPETIPTMETIWSTFLPWFHSKVVHIGADEYQSSLVADYTYFVNTMHAYIQNQSGKDIRIWGTFTPKQGANVSKEVSIQHWEFFEDNPYFDYIMNGYNVLNSDDAFYVVGKWSGSYPQVLNETRVFYGNPAGGSYAPNIFDSKNATNNPPRTNPNVLGQLAAVWNDYGPNATTVLEAYYSVRDVLPALADKQWGGDLTESEYNSIFNVLHASIPAQNLDRAIKSKSDLILSYKFDEDTVHGRRVQDISGNGYDGKLYGKGCGVKQSALSMSGDCYLETPLHSKGRNYTLSFAIKPTTARPVSLFSGRDSTLVSGNGTVESVAMLSGGNAYFLNYTLPAHTWTNVELIGRGNQTFFSASDSGNQRNLEMEFLTIMGINGQSFVWAPMAFEAPLRRIGEGFVGSIRDIELRASVYN